MDEHGGKGRRGGFQGPSPPQLPSGSNLACQSEADEGTPSPSPEQKTTHWNLVQSRMKELLEPAVTRTRDRWQWLWSLSGLRGFMQTYYEDHLRDLGPRTKTWLLESKDSLLNKTYSLCPRLLCADEN
ncbi:apolipoprotein C-IV isoform X1 [Callithrix jacchus]